MSVVDRGPPGGAPYAQLQGAPPPQAMVEKPKIHLVQVGDIAITTDKIKTMRASCNCFCCCSSTLKIEFEDPHTNRTWVQKFRFCCDPDAATITLTKLRTHIGGAQL